MTITSMEYRSGDRRYEAGLRGRRVLDCRRQPKRSLACYSDESERSFGQATFVTTEEVLDEFLAHYSGHGPAMRGVAASTVTKAQSNPLVRVLPQSHQSFLNGLALYKARPDKAYSLTGCISMETMRHEGISEILTHDNHFTQEGFTILL